MNLDHVNDFAIDYLWGIVLLSLGNWSQDPLVPAAQAGEKQAEHMQPSPSYADCVFSPLI